MVRLFLGHALKWDGAFRGSLRRTFQRAWEINISVLCSSVKFETLFNALRVIGNSCLERRFWDYFLEE